MVEGFSAGATQPQKRVSNFVGVGEDFLCADAEYSNALQREPFVSASIALRPVASVMREAINFNRQLRRRAIEIERV